jgi:hypothetical protein
MMQYIPGTMDTIYGFSGKSFEKIVQKKDPGNRENGGYGALECGWVKCRGKNFMGDMLVHVILAAVGADLKPGHLLRQGSFRRDQR